MQICNFQWAIFFRRVGDVFYKCPILSHIFFTSKHSLSPLQNSTKIFNQIQTSQALIPDSRRNLKLQFSIPIFIKDSPKLRYVGLIVEIFLSTSPTIYPLFLLHVYGSLWLFMNSWSMELLLHTLLWSILHIIMKWNYYVMFMVFMLPWSNYEGWYIYVCCWWADLYGFWNWLDLVLLKYMILFT